MNKAYEEEVVKTVLARESCGWGRKNKAEGNDSGRFDVREILWGASVGKRCENGTKMLRYGNPDYSCKGIAIGLE
jgi:hypothetical protein